MDEPILYIIDGTNYDFNEFLKSANAGIGDYIASLKRGDKDDDYFYKAYDDLMNGIKDQTVTFEGGRFHDSLGRYRNGEINYNGELIKSNKKSKDYYGLIANYINSVARAQKEYAKPTEKKKEKLTDNIIRQRLYNLISNNGVLGYDALNSLDEEGKYTNLFGKINSGLAGFNFDNEFKDYDYDDTLKNKWTGNEGIISSASKAISDGNYDTPDLYALKNLYGGYYDKIFTKPVPPQDTQQNSISYLLQFEQYLNDNNYNILISDPDIDLTSAQPLGNYTKEQFISSIQDQDFNNVVSKIFALDKDDNFKNSFLLATVNKFIDKFINLSDNEKYYPVPNADNTVWTIKTDSSGKLYLSKKRMIDIPEFLNLIISEWATKNNLSFLDNNQWYSKYFVASKKEGGILKAKDGTKTVSGVKYTGQDSWNKRIFSKSLPLILEGLKNKTFDYKHLNDLQDTHKNFYDKWDKANAFEGTENDIYNYQSEINNHFSNINDAIQEGLSNDNYEYSNNPVTKDNSKNGWADNYYSAMTDDRRVLGRKGDFTSGELFDIMNLFKSLGYNFYLDPLTNYYKLEELPSELKVETTKAQHFGENPDVEKANKLLQNELIPNDLDFSSNVNPVKQKEKDSKSYFGKGLENAIALGRLYNSLRTNQKNYNTLRRSLKPLLKDTYELYSPVTGNYEEMTNYYNMAADKYKQATKPFTSDATLSLAGLLEANRQADEDKAKGKHLDNVAIKESSEKARTLQYDNQKRRSDNANFNKASIIENNLKLDQLKAAQRTQNWKAIDNFLEEIGNRSASNSKEHKDLLRNFRLQKAQADIENKYNDALEPKLLALKQWQSNNTNKENGFIPNITSAPGYEKYINLKRKLDEWKQDQFFNTQANIYGLPYTINPNLNYNKIIKGFKLGGTIENRLLNIINRINNK